MCLPRFPALALDVMGLNEIVVLIMEIGNEGLHTIIFSLLHKIGDLDVLNQLII